MVYNSKIYTIGDECNVYFMPWIGSGKSMTRKQAVKAADTAFSLYIRARDKSCVTCGSYKSLQCSHLFSRIAYSTRWNTQNAACQCSSCNLKHEYDPGPFTLWYLREYGNEMYEHIHSLYSSMVKFKTYQIEEIARYYRGKLKELT